MLYRGYMKKIPPHFLVFIVFIIVAHISSKYAFAENFLITQLTHDNDNGSVRFSDSDAGRIVLRGKGY